jgi:hypothetical protein
MGNPLRDIFSAVSGRANDRDSGTGGSPAIAL